jgi:hypothetical protein
MTAFGPFAPPPAPEFRGASDVYQYCTEFAARLSAMALEHEISALQLQKALGQIPDDRMGMRSKFKARLVAGHIRRAAMSCEAASMQITGAYLALVAAAQEREAAERAAKAANGAAREAMSSGVAMPRKVD